MKTSLPIDCVLDAKAQIGEGAIWCSLQQVLYWVDIPAGILHRFDPSSSTNQSWSMGEALGCFALTEHATLVLALASGFYEFSPETGTKKRLAGRTRNRSATYLSSRRSYRKEWICCKKRMLKTSLANSNTKSRMRASFKSRAKISSYLYSSC